jgi:hypothetical protein
MRFGGFMSRLLLRGHKDQPEIIAVRHHRLDHTDGTAQACEGYQVGDLEAGVTQGVEDSLDGVLGLHVLVELGRLLRFAMPALPR